MKEWKKTLVTEGDSLRTVIETINDAQVQVALVVDEKGRLKGTISDGDIRRALISEKTLETKASEIMNPRPSVCSVADDRTTIINVMVEKNLRQLPVIDEQGIVVGLQVLLNLLEEKLYKNTVVIMAGGMGTRLRPYTEDCPKPMLKVGGKPMLELILERFLKHGFRKFYISVNYLSHMIEDYFGDGSRWGAQITYLREDKKLGTAGAVAQLKGRLEDPFFVINGDILTDVNFSHLLDYHCASECDCTVCVRDYEFEVPFGVLKTDDNHHVIGIREKPVYRFHVNGGIYLLNPSTLSLIPDNTSYDMPQLIGRLIDEKRKVDTFLIHEYWVDVGRHDEYHKANADLKVDGV